MAKAEAARTYVAAAAANALLFPSVATAELGFVLLRVYRWPFGRVADPIRAIVSHPAIDAQDDSLWLDVADDLDEGRGLIDAYLMRAAVRAGAPVLVSFDAEMEPVAGVICQAP